MEVFLGGVDAGQPNGLFILGVARPEWRLPQELEMLIKPSVSAEKDADKRAVEISLAPLTDLATRELAKELLQRAADVPEQVIDLLAERSEGVPYFAEEMVNWFIDHEILDTRGEQWRFLPERLREQPLPATLQHLLLTRLSSLSQPERAALQRGAIFGRRFWTGGVEALGVPAGAETLGHLQPRGFVEVQPESAFQGDTEWSFHQSLLQEVTYESVLKRERAALHKVAAGWMERQARQAGRLDEFAGLLGEHCERAGDLSAAADWYLRAGKCAMGQGAPREAKGFYSQALDLLPPIDRERRWQALLGREDALSVLGEPEPRKADIAALQDLARTFEDDNYVAEAYLRHAVFGVQAGDIPIVAQASQESLAAARRCGSEAMEAKALAVATIVDLNRGDRPAITLNIEQALRLARRLGDENVLAFVLYRAAFAYGELGDFARNDSLQTEQIELDHRLGNRSQEATGLGNKGALLTVIGLYKQARALVEQARAISEGLGARRPLAYHLSNLGDIYRATGDLRQARQLFEQALLTIAPTQDMRGKSGMLNDLGTILLGMGDVPGAARRFTEARELALNQGLPAKVYESTASLAACAVVQGQMDQARIYVHEAWDYLREHGWVMMNNPGMVYRNCAETFDALGEEESVRAVLKSGHQALMDVIDKISVPAWRQSFLEDVPENRAVIEMWERRK
jgi:tetratricopeptide (TPR) repeat protein